MKILYLEDNNDIDILISKLPSLHDDSSNYVSSFSLPFDYVLVPIHSFTDFVETNVLNSATLDFGDVVINNITNEVFVNNNKAVLSKREYDLLLYLASKSPGVISKDKLLTQVWHDYGNVMSNTVEVHINKLRKKIGKKYILCVKGFGYRFIKE